MKLINLSGNSLMYTEGRFDPPNLIKFLPSGPEVEFEYETTIEDGLRVFKVNNLPEPEEGTKIIVGDAISDMYLIGRDDLIDHEWDYSTYLEHSDGCHAHGNNLYIKDDNDGCLVCLSNLVK